MNIDEHNQKVTEFSNAVKRLYQTKDGKHVLDTLKDTYLEASSIAADTHRTYYNLGRADLVRFLFETLK